MSPFLSITEVCDFEGGSQPPKSEWIKKPKDGFIRMLQIRDFTQPEKDNIEYIKLKNNTKVCKVEDILIGRYGASIGKICTGLEGAYNVALMKTIPDPKKLKRKYLFYILNSYHFQHFILNVGSRAAQAGFNKDDLSRFKIPLPPLKTQEHIASILDDAAALRDKTAQLLEEYDRLAQSIFLDMFGDPVSNPKEWDVSQLVEITNKIGSGATPRGGKNSYKEEGISLIRSLNIHDNKFKFKDLAFIDDEQAEKLQNVTIEENDVLINITGASVARCAIVPVDILPARVNQHVSILRCKPEKINPVFLLHLIISPNTKIKLLGVGSSSGATRESITKSQLEDFEIILPSIAIQNDFAEKIALIEQQKELARQELKESEDLFNCLLQKAFKGELVRESEEV